MKIKTFEYIVGIFLAVMTIWAIFSIAPKVYDIYRNKPETQVRVDTVITEKHDTILLKDVKPYSEIHFKKVIDTLRTTDSVFVPIEVPLSLKKYEGDTLSTDGTKVHYRASISGYRQNLDTLWMDVERNEKTITKEIIKWKEKKGFKIVPYAGYGYNPIDKKFCPSVGLAIAYVF